MCGAGGMGCEAGVGIQMGSAEVTFLISLSIFYRLFRPCTLCSTTHPLPTHAQLTLCRLIPSSTHSVYTPPPPRGKGSGGVPSKHVPSPTYFALPSCFVRVSNKTDGQEKKMEKRGKKDYRLAFRAPRGPLSSIRSERAANHQSCYFSLSLPLSLQGPLSMKRAI